MRGKLANENADLSGLGITPADAGKTVAELVAEGKLQDHPRGCGENVA